VAILDRHCGLDQEWAHLAQRDTGVVYPWLVQDGQQAAIGGQHLAVVGWTKVR
jgi:hypothetical protein